MPVMRLLSMFFTNGKTLKRAMHHLNKSGHIQLSPKIYKESIQFHKSVVISGSKDGETIIEGLLTIPKSVSVKFCNVTISPITHIYVEGEVEFEQCHLDGMNTSVLVTVNGGKITASHCEITDAADRAITLQKQSTGVFHHCKFQNNGKAHIEVEGSEATIEECQFSEARYAYWIKNNGLVHSTKAHLHHQSHAQIYVDHSTFIDQGSVIERGDEHGIYAKKESNISLENTTLRYHKKSQILIQRSSLDGSHCFVQHGMDVGISIREYAEVNFSYSEVSQHENANIQVAKRSRLNLAHCHIYSGKSFGVQVNDKSIVNFYETLFKSHKLAQVFLSGESICSVKNSLVKEGKHVGIYIEKKSNCTIVESKITEQSNSALSVIGGQLTVIDSEIMYNFGNAILGMSNSTIEVDGSKMYNNDMAHIALKANVKMNLLNSELYNGKSLILDTRCNVKGVNCKFYESENVQIEITEKSTLTLEQCRIFNGKSYGVKVLKDSHFFFYDGQISHHILTQIVVNDSSAVVRDSELYKGCRNAISVQNHSEVLVQDSFISKHAQSQIWLDLESTIELKGVQLTDGYHSDLYAQNQSEIYVTDSMIRNDKVLYNVRAVNYSKIELSKTIVDNRLGDTFYSENNSFITSSDL
ncbi:right-handed parallel beta-helix repeat-containing protein [Ureibacillus sp. NPDC094379]